jgi:phosphoglycolate phosphatase
MTFTTLSFDLDGTLVDTAGEIAEAANLTLAEFRVPAQPQALITRLIGAGTRELMLKLLAHVLLERPLRAAALPVDQVIDRFDHHYALTVGTQGRPYAGCHEMLQRLQDAGIRLACVTNKEQRFAQRVLLAHRLDGFFEVLVGGDTLPHKKPHRHVIDHVLQVLGARQEQMAHVGDSHTDVDTARNAGVAAWAVPYGYNRGDPIAEANPHRIFQTLPEIAAHVLSDSACTPRTRTHPALHTSFNLT